MFEELGKFLQGYSLDSHKIFGVHKEEGIKFRVYAPNAKEVELKGDFSDWQGIKMNKVSASGIYEVTVNNAKENDKYLYNILTKENNWIEKLDCYSLMIEDNKSKYIDVLDYEWKDERWMKKRTSNEELPVNIYELKTFNFANSKELSDYLKKYHYTHVEIPFLLEQTKDNEIRCLYSISNIYNNPKELMNLIDHLHQNNIGVIANYDFISISKEELAILNFDGNNAYDNNSNLDLNKNCTRSYLLSNISYLLEYYHLDGLKFMRVNDIVSFDSKKEKELIEGSIGFIKRINSSIKEKYPSVMLIVDDKDNNPKLSKKIKDGGLGFDYRVDRNLMDNIVKYFSVEPESRKDNHKLISASYDDYFNDKRILSLDKDSLEKIKENIYGTDEEKNNQLKIIYTFMITSPLKKISYIEDNEKMNEFVKNLNKIYEEEISLSKGDLVDTGFKWMMKENKRQGLVTFYRRHRIEYNVIVLNMSPNTYEKYEIGVPQYGYYEEILNSNDIKYGGDGYTSKEYFTTREKKLHDQESVLKTNIPAYSALIYRKMKNV